DERRVPLRALNTLFGGGFTSRINQNLREAHGWTYGASSHFALEPSTGYFVVATSVRADATGPALKEVLAEIRRIRGGDVSEEEAAKARETLRADAVQSFQELGGLVGVASELVVNGLPFEAFAKDTARLETVRAEELNTLAKTSIPLEKGVLV